MSQLFKIRNHLQSMMTALDNVDYGRMPLEHFEQVFELREEYIRSALEAEKFNRKVKEAA